MLGKVLSNLERWKDALYCYQSKDHRRFFFNDRENPEPVKVPFAGHAHLNIHCWCYVTQLT